MQKQTHKNKSNIEHNSGKSLGVNGKENSKSTTAIILFSIAFNILAFLIVIATYPPCWYTNDDYRMMTIVSGAYTGTPNADIVFMRYPIGLLLSGLYTLTAQIPWYGVFTMLCMFIPSCIFCYYLTKKAYMKNCTILGVLIYVLAFVCLIQKYICLPQYTLTSSFMSAGAIVLLMEMPAKKNTIHIILATICMTLAFSIRSKAFYMILPVIALIVIVRLINEKGSGIYKPFLAIFMSSVVICGAVYAVDYSAWNRSLEYQEYNQFNKARHLAYDYGGIPAYYDNMPFYVSNDISEVAYQSLSSRYLDLDETVDTETLEVIGDYIQQVRSGTGSFTERLKVAFEETIEYWLDSGDEIVKYSVIFVFILLGITLIASAKMKKKKINIVFPLSVAGFILESVYLEFAGRLVVRIVDMLLLVTGIIGCLTLVNMLEVKRKSFKDYLRSFNNNKTKYIYVCFIICATVFVAYSGISGLNIALKDKYYSVSVTQNRRLDALKSYAETHPDSFFFYDTKDFISCTEYAFKTYEKGQVLNHDSLGSWNCHSPTYYERNAMYGFTSSVDGLINDDCNVYFIATGSIKKGMTKTLKDTYNKKLRLVENIEADGYILHKYLVVDDD